MGVVEDLERLKQLKDTGAITETEFEIEKSKVLNGSLNSKTNADKKATFGMIGFILGLVSIIGWYIPVIGYPLTVIGIIFSGLGLNSNNRSKAIAGLTLSIIFLIVTLINSLLGVILYSYLYY